MIKVANFCCIPLIVSSSLNTASTLRGETYILVPFRDLFAYVTLEPTRVNLYRSSEIKTKLCLWFLCQDMFDRVLMLVD